MPEQDFTDAIALLKADHRKVEQLFAAFEKRERRRPQGKAGAGNLHRAQDPHHDRGGDFLSGLRGKIEDDLLDEAYVEHDGAKVLINDIEAGGPDDDFYDAKVKVLSEEIEHHVKEEEKPAEGMFAQSRKTDVDLVAMRDAMLARKEELLAQAERDGLPPAKVDRRRPRPA